MCAHVQEEAPYQRNYTGQRLEIQLTLENHTSSCHDNKHTHTNTGGSYSFSISCGPLIRCRGSTSGASHQRSSLTTDTHTLKASSPCKDDPCRQTSKIRRKPSWRLFPSSDLTSLDVCVCVCQWKDLLHISNTYCNHTHAHTLSSPKHLRTFLASPH